MDILVFLIVGIFSGWIASMLIQGHGLGLLGDLIVGIIGAFIGGYTFNALGVTAYGFWGSVGMSAVGAVLFLFIVGLFSSSRHQPKNL